MIKQNNLMTKIIRPNENISFPIGTILAVKEYYKKLSFHEVFYKFKNRGLDINSLIQGLLSYKLTENFSISKASDWINRKQILEEFELKNFHEKSLFRTLGILGKNREEIIANIQTNLFNKYDFEHTNVNIDWTSLVIWGDMCKLAKHGFSKDHRPDKKQISLGISEIANPINVPIGITIESGNMSDMNHFQKSYDQIKNSLQPNSRITFDKGANSKENLERIIAEKMRYLTAKKLNKSDDKRIRNFDKLKVECLDKEKGIYGIKFHKPSKIDYLYFSEDLKQTQLKSKRKKALRLLNEAIEIQKSLDKNKNLPKRFQIKNKLVDVKYDYQTKLKELDEKEALNYLEKEVINGREGFFCLISNENLTLKEALEIYRKKDSVEKMIHSLKNEIEIKPLRVWTENSIYGAIIIGFIAQLFMSLIKYENDELKNVSIKFIKNSIMNLTVTVEIFTNKKKREVYANFDFINKLILAINDEIT